MTDHEAAEATTHEEIPMSTDTTFTKQAERLAEETARQAEELRVRGLETSRQLAELSLDLSERAVKQGADLYLQAADALPFPLVKELARAQTDLALRATDIVVRQSRELLAR